MHALTKEFTELSVHNDTVIYEGERNQNLRSKNAGVKVTCSAAVNCASALSMQFTEIQ